MLVNTQISPQKNLTKQNFGHTVPDFVLPMATNATTETNLNNSPSVQNKVLVQAYKPDYKEIQNFEVPNIGKGKMYQLKNGHKVIILPKPGTTNIITHVKVGATDEPQKLKGLSHLLEHLTCPYQLLGSGVISNAETSRNLTQYYVQFVHKNNQELEQNIKIQSKIINGSTFSSEEFQKEKNIVIAEMSRDRILSFEEKADKISLENLFGKGNIEKNIGGFEDTLSSITEKDLRAHYDKFYAPDNMVTTIVGEVEPDETIKMVSKYFNAPSRQKSRWESNSASDFSHHLQEAKRVDLVNPEYEESSSANIKFIGPPYSSLKEKETANILCNILKNSKAFTALEEKFDHKPYVSTYHMDYRKNSPMIFKFNINFKEKDKKELKTIYNALFESINTPIKDEDFDREKKESLRNCCNEESSFMVGDYIGRQVALGRDADVHSKDIEIVNSITKEDVEAMAKKYLDLNKASIVVTHPPQKTESVTFGQSKYVEQYELPNNMIVVVDTTPGTIKTTLNIELVNSDKIKPLKGSSLVLNDILSDKSKKMDKIQGLSVVTSSSLNGLNAKISGEPDKLVLGIKQIKEIFHKPGFNEVSMEKSRRNWKEFLSINNKVHVEDKEAELFQTFIPGEYEANMDKIKLQDIENFHKQILTNSQATAVITMPAKDFALHKNKILNELNQGFPPLHKLQKIEEEDGPKDLDKAYLILDKKDANDNQAILRQSYKVFYSENAKDNAAKALLTEIIRAKITADLREKQNITYSPQVERKDSILLLKVDTDISTHPEHIKKVLESFDRTTQYLMENTIDAKELESFKKNIVINDVAAFEISTTRNSYCSEGLNYPYGLDYEEATDESLKNLRSEDIKRAAQLVFANPCVTSVSASEAALEANKEYLLTKGQLNFLI